MKSSYKPKFLEAFLKETIEDSVPELVQINDSVEDDDVFAQEVFKTNKKQLNTVSDKKKLDVSQHRINSDQELKATQRLTIRIEELESFLKEERKRVANYEEQLEQFEILLGRMQTKHKLLQSRVKESEEVVEELRESKHQLQKEVKQLRLSESSYMSARSASPTPHKDQTKKEIFQKLELYMKRLIEDFIQTLKPQRISKVVEGKIEEFLAQLLQINIVTIDRNSKNKFTSKESHKLNNSYNSPYHTSFGNTYDSIDAPQEMSIVERKIAETSPKKVERHGARFNFIRESVDPSVTDQSAFVSISHVGRGQTERSEEKGRSKSQRRRKIFS